MPEGPELYMASVFVNSVCADILFTGAVEKSQISKGAEVPFVNDSYRITSASRGKEVRLTLTPVTVHTDSMTPAQNQTPMDVVFRFGMSGYFRFTARTELPKHAHLRFYSRESPQRVLSFVDTRRFGSWHHGVNWHPNRGPCVMSEYESFRNNVLSNLSDKAFDRPICEALLNQKYFNGIGNYLRAEILYRLSIPPFMKARTVLEGLDAKNSKPINIKEEEEDNTEKEESKADVKKLTESSDLLSFCHSVPMEVLHLGGKGYDPANADYTGFASWLQCYSVEGMKSVLDHNKRTIWFKGDPGPMAPKASKASKRKPKIKKRKHDYTLKKDKSVKKEEEEVKIDVPKKQSGTKKQRGKELANEIKSMLKSVKKEEEEVKINEPKKQSGTKKQRGKESANEIKSMLKAVKKEKEEVKITVPKKQSGTKKRRGKESANEIKRPKIHNKSRSESLQTPTTESTGQSIIQKANTKAKKTSRPSRKSKADK